MTIKNIIKYRNIWMGIAIIWVMLYHSGIQHSNVILSRIQSVGYGGVDIFILASGIGNYYSYTRDKNPLEFLKRRLNKIIPIYLPFIIAWIIAEYILKNMDYRSAIGNFFGIQGLTCNGKEFNWYLTAMVVTYILTPFIASFVEQYDNKKNILLFLISIIASIAFWNNTTFIITVTRMPLYIFGMIIAKNQEKTVTLKHHICGLMLCVLGFILLHLAKIYVADYLWKYGLYWYPFILTTPFICYTISWGIEKMNRLKFVDKITELIEKIGKHTFELFLTHIFVIDKTSKLIRYGYITDNNGLRISALVISTILAIVLYFISKHMRKYLKC